MTESNGAGAYWHTLLEEQAAREKFQTEIAFPHNKAAVCDALAMAGIESVTVTFEGSSDAGQIEDISAFGSGNAAVPIPGVEVTLKIAGADGSDAGVKVTRLRDAIEELAYDHLETAHAGWEIDAGAFGQFIFDVAARSITFQYNQRYEDSEFFETTL